MTSHQKLLKKIISHFTRHDWPALPGRTNHLHAGILVPILVDDDWTCILTRRTPHLRTHSKEICFPGGKPDPEDKSLQETALREANEELTLEGGEVLTKLSSVPLYTSEFRLHPFLALFPQETTIVANPAEVADVLPMSIRSILSLPFLDGAEFDLEGTTYISPIFIPSKVGLSIEQPIYGGTAHVLYETITLVAQALNVSVPPLKVTFDQFPFVHTTN